MQESVGKRLYNARIERGLTVEDAAHATRMRPDKILALENNDYSRFGGNAYAKGFLLIYSRFLKVDVSDEARALETPRNVPLSDYQYLTNLPQPVSRSTPRHLPRHRQKKPSIIPLIVFVLVIAGGVLAFFVQVMVKRMDGRLDSLTAVSSPNDGTAADAALGKRNNVAQGSGNSAPEVIRAEPITRDSGTPTDLGATTNGVPARPTGAAPGSDATAAGAAVLPGVNTVPTPSSVLPATPVATPAPVSGAKDISIAARKKTWVTIYQDGISEPIFVDYIYPKDGPLKLRGPVSIQANDLGALEIRKNGALVAYQPGTLIR